MVLVGPAIPLLLILIALVVFFIILLLRRGGTANRPNDHLRGRDRDAALRDATKRLSQNPRDADALLVVAEIHYVDGDFEKAMKEYEILIGLCATNPSLDSYEMTVKYALSALNSDHKEEAYGSLLIAHSMKSDGFDVNFNLGVLEFERKNYEKAVSHLSQARVLEPEHPATLRYLGHSLFGARRYAEAATLLRKAVELAPDDKDSLFAMARSYHELGHQDQALKIFSHLRPDPTLGPHAALYAGTIHLKTRAYDEAVTDFQIGLRHEKIEQEIGLELKYRLAATYIKQEQIASALELLEEIKEASPDYRDVSQLTERYRELSLNENLKVFLISQTSDFISLCRRLVLSFFSEGKAKVTDVSVQRSEYSDILTEVTSSKSVDSYLFRFVRTTGTVGELILRDFYSRLKDVRAARGYCITAGAFSDGAKQFVEARPVDLIEKEELTRRLQRLRR